MWTEEYKPLWDIFSGWVDECVSWSSFLQCRMPWLGPVSLNDGRLHHAVREHASSLSLLVGSG